MSKTQQPRITQKPMKDLKEQHTLTSRPFCISLYSGIITFDVCVEGSPR